VPNEVVEKYRLEGDTSGASAAVKKFEAEHDRSLSAVERKAKIAAIEQQAAAEKAAAAQVSAANKSADAQERATQRALVKVELLKKAFNLAARAISEMGRSAIEAEKELAEQDRVVTHLADSWDKFNRALATSITQAPTIKTGLEGITNTLDAMGQALSVSGGSVLEALMVAGDVAFLGGERTVAAMERFKGAKQGEGAGTFDFKGEKGSGGFAVGGEKGGVELDMDRLGEEWAAAQADQAKRELDAWQFKEDAKTKIAEEAEKNRLDVVRRGEEWQEKQQAESLRRFEKEQDYKLKLMEESARQMGAVVEEGVGIATGAIESLVEGGVLGFAKFAADKGRQYGIELIASGAKDIAEGWGHSLNPAAPGSGAGMIAAGGAEIALGSAMFAGGLAAGAAMAGASGGGGAGGAGSAGATMPPTQRSPETITINLTTMGKWGQSEHAAFQRQVGGALGRRYR